MGLRENILNEPVSRLELRDVLTVRRKTAVREAVRLMRDNRLGCAIVIDAKNKPVGKFTEHLLTRMLVTDVSSLDQPVDHFMYDSADTISQDQPIQDMMKFMKAKSLRYVCVVDKKGHAIGLAGHKSLVGFIVEHFPRLVKVQRMSSMISMQEAEGA